MSTQKPTAPSSAKPQDAEARTRREVTRMLKGPVAARFQSLIPPLAQSADPFHAIIESPDLLDAGFKLFRARRDAFAEFLVDNDGQPVSDDQTRLKCGRSVDEVIGMVVRTGMRSYAEAHFGDLIDPSKAPAKAAPPKPAPKPASSNLLRLISAPKLSELFRRNLGSGHPPKAGQSKSGQFYGAIKDHLDFAWQVRFFPIYVEIPAHVFERLGHGITHLDSEEKLNRLANLAMADLQKAEQIIRDPALVREMLEHNVLASKAVSDLGEAGFEAVHSALSGIDANKKWDVFANRDTAVKLHEDKRITKGDISALADYLDILNEFALDAMLDLHLNRDQMQMFLKTAEDNLGRTLFLALFGPIQTLVPDDLEEQQKLRRYQNFTQSALRGLVTAVNQLENSLSLPGEKAEIAECLATVCRARRIDLEKDAKRLAPATLNA